MGFALCSGSLFKEDIKTEDAEWRKILEESESEIEEKPCLKNVYDEFIRERDSLISALMYRLAKLLGNDLVNCSELLELFLGFFAYNGDIRAEIRKDLNAVRVPSVPNRSYVETLLYSQGFLALQAHKVAHKLWSGYSKKLPFYSTGLTFAEQYSNCFTWKSQRWQWKATVLYQ